MQIHKFTTLLCPKTRIVPTHERRKGKRMYSFLQVVKHDEPLSTGCDEGGNKPFVELVHNLQIHLGAPDNQKKY